MCDTCELLLFLPAVVASLELDLEREVIISHSHVEPNWIEIEGHREL